MQWVTCGTGMVRNHPKPESWTKTSGLVMFIAKNKETVREAQTRAFYGLWCPFMERVTCGNGMVGNHPKHESWTKTSRLGMLVAKNKETVWEAETRAFYALWCPFMLRVTCRNGMVGNHHKQESWTKTSGLGMFVVRKQERVVETQTRAL